MVDPDSSELPFEIIFTDREPTPQAPAVLQRRPDPAVALRPERLLGIVRFLMLLSVAALIACLAWLINSSRPVDRGASAEVSRTEAPEPAEPVVREAAVELPAEPVAPAPAPVAKPLAEEPIPAAPAARPVSAVEPAGDPADSLDADLFNPGRPEDRVPAPEAPDPQRLVEEARSFESKDPALAVSRYRKVVELFPARTELWKTIADLDLGRGAVDEAARAYREFLRNHRDRADALQNLAVLEIRSGRGDEARACLEAAIRSAPSADLYFNLGLVHGNALKFDAAVAAYRRALEYKPDHLDARFNLALALEQIGRRAEAVSVLAQLPTASPEFSRERARMEAMMGGAEAVHALDVARTSADVEMVLGVASGFRRAGEMEKALALLDRAVELAPRQASLRLNRGALRHAMGQLREASLDYEEAATLDPSLPEVAFNRGVLAEERGQYVAALDHYAAALKLQPQMTCALNNVGALYLRVGQAEKSVDWFRRCRAADATFAPARINLAWANLALGMKDLALADLKAIALDTPKEDRPPDVARVLGELEAAAPASAVRR